MRNDNADNHSEMEMRNEIKRIKGQTRKNIPKNALPTLCFRFITFEFGLTADTGSDERCVDSPSTRNFPSMTEPQ
jgi:hypothetical protein